MKTTETAPHTALESASLHQPSLTLQSRSVTPQLHPQLHMIASEKIEEHQIEVAKYELNRIDLDKVSRDAITSKSRAALRLAVVIIVQGLSESVRFLHSPKALLLCTQT